VNLRTGKSFFPRGSNSHDTGIPDYRKYSLSPSEWLRYTLYGAAAAAAVAYVFYRNILAFLIFIPFVIYYPFYKKKDLIPARKRKLLLQFREGLSVLSGALSAGYSMENALEESVHELKLLYGADAMIVREFEYMSHLVSMNIPIEKAMDEFAERSGLDDIRNFSRVLRIAKRSGGEIVPIIRHTADVIGDKVQVKEEILTLTASKRFEQNIMNLIPLIIVLYIDRTSPGFFTLMYTTIVGRIVMTGCLFSYLFALKLSWKILNIEV
jgi:tight adherence protein B